MLTTPRFPTVTADLAELEEFVEVMVGAIELMRVEVGDLGTREEIDEAG